MSSRKRKNNNDNNNNLDIDLENSLISSILSTPKSNKHIRFDEGINLSNINITPILKKYNNSEQKEKRAARTRKRPTVDILKRIERALSQRLYLLSQSDISTEGNLGRSYEVLGSTGNCYDVVIDRCPSCTCPDFENGNLCKHILFVYLRVLRCPENSPIICQEALLQDELASLFLSSKISKNSKKKTSLPSTIPSPSSSVPSTVSTTSPSSSNHASLNSSNRSAPIIISLVDSESETNSDGGGGGGETKNNNNKKNNNNNTPEVTIILSESEEDNENDDIIPDDSECPICFEEMKSRKESVEKCGVCKNYLHSDCLKKWLKQSKTCVYCRSPWMNATLSTSISSTTTINHPTHFNQRRHQRYY